MKVPATSREGQSDRCLMKKDMKSKTKPTLPEQKKCPPPSSPSRKKSRKSDDQVERKPTQPGAARICICAIKAKKTVSL